MGSINPSPIEFDLTSKNKIDGRHRQSLDVRWFCGMEFPFVPTPNCKMYCISYRLHRVNKAEWKSLEREPNPTICPSIVDVFGFGFKITFITSGRFHNRCIHL